MATTTLQSLKSAIGVGARSNLFKVSYDTTAFGTNPLATQAGFLTKAAALPASTLGIIEVPFRGRRLKIAGDRTFAEWTATVISDQDFKVRTALEDFQEKFNTTDYSAALLGDRSSDTSTVTIQQLNNGGAAIRTYNLENCFISEIGAIDLSYDTTDAIEEYTVTWVYEYFTTTDYTAAEAT